MKIKIKTFLFAFTLLITTSIFSQDITNSEESKIASISLSGEVSNVSNQLIGEISLTGEVKNSQGTTLGTVTRVDFKNPAGIVIGIIDDTEHGKLKIKNPNGVLLGYVLYGNEVYSANDDLLFKSEEPILDIYLAAFFIHFYNGI